MVWPLAHYNAPATIKSITARIMPPPTTKTIAGSPSLHPLTLSDICYHRYLAPHSLSLCCHRYLAPHSISLL